MSFYLISMVTLMISVLVSVAFLTLLERKILGYIQKRKGPNKAGLLGIMQPFADAIKLISKEWMFINSNKTMFSASPMLMMMMALIMWIVYPWTNLYMMNMSVMFLIMMLGLNIYPSVLIGWVSNNNYSMLGSIRSVAQMISFEISLFLMFFLIMMLIESYSMLPLTVFQFKVKFSLLILPVYIMFFSSMLIELNRTPFDLIEGESELVSGFNVEFYSSFFVLIFLAEYSGIIFISLIMTTFFFGFKINSIMFIMSMMMHMMLILWIRGVLPRIRYDTLMNMCWTDFLTCVLIYNLLIYMIKETLN